MIATDITFIIKTFDRPQCLARLLESIDKRYPDVPAVVANDGHDPVQISRPNTVNLRLPFDVGLKAGRMAALAEVKTDYFVLLDDDFIVSDKTNLEEWLRITKAHQLDICGADVLDSGTWSTNFRHDLVFENGLLEFKSIPITANEQEIIKCDMVANFYLAHTERFRSFGGWDKRLKIGGHEALFFVLKSKGAKIGWAKRIGITHQPYHEGPYLNYRNRAYDFWPEIARKEHGIYHCNDWLHVPPQNSNAFLCLPESYQQRDSVPDFDDTTNKDEYQKEVYQIALKESEAIAGAVLDVGCGSGFKTIQFFPMRQIIGTELPKTLEFLKRTRKVGRWEPHDVDYSTLEAGLVVCADVLEHVQDPTALLRRILRVKGAQLYLLSTPDRARLASSTHNGPPGNMHHLREWTLGEFGNYLNRFFKVEAVKIVNEHQATMLAWCRKAS